MDTLKNILSIIVYLVITGCGVAIVTELLKIGNKKVDELQANTKLAEHDQLNVVIDRAQSVITSIVQSINQTFVSDLKKSGEFTKDSAALAKDMALEKAKELITEEAAKAIQDVYGNVDEYLDIFIEQVVNELKNK